LTLSLRAIEDGFNESLKAMQGTFNESLKATERTFNESLKATETQTASSINELQSELTSKSSADEIQFREKANATALLELQGEQKRILQQLHDHTRMAMDQQRRLSILLAEVRQHLTPMDNTERLGRIASERDHLLDSMYFTLEERFRGTREDIKDRLTVYLPYIESLRASVTAMGSMSALDVGCGRGEFLELFRDKGILAKGVDLNRIFVAECRKMDLDVVEGEARFFLRQQRDGSFNAVSAIHVLEHLSFEELIALLDEMLRVLKPQGLVILETPNPNNVLVGSGRFYLDPTHQKPLPPALLQFLVEARGFCNVQVQELHPFPSFSQLPDPDSALAQRFNELFYGPQDYAIIAYKL
jgi:2-polyprenyl-3-methyl-5-hydroxy-6-metoxy-1,4-benzoquinol methylase